MRIFKKFLFTYFFIVLLLTGCKNEDAAFRDFTQSLFQSEVASTTIGLHYSLRNPESYDIREYPITFGSFDSNELVKALYETGENPVFEVFTINGKATIADFSGEPPKTFDI